MLTPPDAAAVVAKPRAAGDRAMAHFAPHCQDHGQFTNLYTSGDFTTYLEVSGLVKLGSKI
jgi:hypothetical protein